jgi:hypothetical protein
MANVQQSVYQTGMNPQVAAATNGWEDMNSFAPAQAIAEPPDDIINAMFPCVLSVTKLATGACHLLDVLDALQHCKEHQVRLQAVCFVQVFSMILG